LASPEAGFNPFETLIPDSVFSVLWFSVYPPPYTLHLNYFPITLIAGGTTASVGAEGTAGKDGAVRQGAVN